MALQTPDLSQDITTTQQLDLSTWPPIYVSNTHFETEDLHELEDDLTAAGALLTYDINEAEIVLSKALKKRRIVLDLNSKGLHTEEVTEETGTTESTKANEATSEQPVTTGKRKRASACPTAGHESDIIVIDSDTESEAESSQKRKKTAQNETVTQNAAKSRARTPPTSQNGLQESRAILVVQVEWFSDSQKAGQVQPTDSYITYRGRRINHQSNTVTPRSTLAIRTPASTLATPPGSSLSQSVRPSPGRNILQRAKEDASESQSRSDRFGRRNFGVSTPSANPSSWEAGHGTQAKYAHLLQETTTEHDEGTSSDLPEPPEWVKMGVKYACQRLTPRQNPNDAFLDLLKKIKFSRLLTNDETGVRAYSTSIASIASYDYKISNAREISRLPGCSDKIANLWVEWKNEGRIKAVDDIEADEDLKVLGTLYNIWGVGATTARQFYYEKGWRDLDDVIENGWDTLERVQKIGVKFYDEFLDLIPRAEVEQICEVIRQHAVKIRDEGIQIMIVGGYRRGKEASGDVDVVLSHPDEKVTANLAEDIVDSLEVEGWISHTLTISLNNTKRGQQTLPFRAGGGGHGFDTLDKALVVMQDPTWPTKDRDLAENEKAKNPNIHRRVDIIVSPWRTVGCAVVGWSGGTTFERDLRRYAKNVKGWKFDSSGVRDRGNGEVVDVEGYYSWKGREGAEARAKTMLEAERRVFESFGLTYREPTERCTG